MEVADLIEGYASCYAAHMPVRLREGFAFDSHDAVASYEGGGYLTMESGCRITCEFQAEKDGNGVVQLLCHHILPTDFAFYLLPLLCNGGSAGFRGTTAAGATIIMDAQRSGRPLEAAVHGQQRIWLVVLSTSQDRSLREGADYGSSQVSIDELRLLPFYAPRGATVPSTAPSNVLEN